MTLPLPFRGLALIFTLAASSALAADDAAAEVQRLDRERIKALLANDVAVLERLYADELVYIHANGRIDNKSGYLASLKAGNLTYVSLQYDPAPKVHVTGNTAVVVGRASIDAKSKAGQVTKRVLTTITVYTRAGAGWKIVSYQGTPAT